MKKEFFLTVGVTLLAIFLAFTDSVETASFPCSEDYPAAIRDEPSDPGHMFVCRISGTFSYENRKCLVFNFEFRNLPGKENPVHAQVDVYVYNALLSAEKTITKRVMIPCPLAILP